MIRRWPVLPGRSWVHVWLDLGSDGIERTGRVLGVFHDGDAEYSSRRWVFLAGPIVHVGTLMVPSWVGPLPRLDEAVTATAGLGWSAERATGDLGSTLAELGALLDRAGDP